MIPELHALAFLGFLVAAAWQDVRTRCVSSVVVFGGVAVSLSLRAMLGAEAHLQGLLGLFLALVAAVAFVAARAATGSDLRVLVMVGAFLGPRDVMVALMAAVAVMLVTTTAHAVLSRAPLRGTRMARVLLSPPPGMSGYGGEITVSTTSAEIPAPRAFSFSHGLAIVLGAMTAWVL